MAVGSASDPEVLTGWADYPGNDVSRVFLRASAVALDDAGVLILGASGSGKSSLALALMAYGAQLVSDDGVIAEQRAAILHLVRPETAPPLIEARGIGLLNAGPVVSSVPLHLAVDLDTPEPDRLPPRRSVAFGAAEAELIRGAGAPTLAPAVIQMLRYGRAHL
ncbi:serine kinase [Gymnodinialimonas sp. 2305UL16-5]|uniref:HPr kinase/phosphorylase n=1 Tax=Gymnodinialimonas mytili TaxID=3126503 RepID=UPI00309FC52A